ncbi:hypothetical protein GS118_004502 [Salmonella enterica]|nr:hypothetical protein [Salmonella enterica]EDW4359689.1 hypothetical protein [Salmonella enterica subsp. salamae]EDS7879944.1 hypothetical protein [Salmonella enterica]EDX9487010.1 hypothetical protein [Salmonella enterica]EEG0758555.1 hypothetical protein [Salmonella enterica]
MAGKGFKSAVILAISVIPLPSGQYPSIQRFFEGARVLITDILHCAFGNQ